MKLNTETDCEELNKFDHVILAIGAHNMDLPMSVTDSNVVSAWDVLAGCEVSGACALLSRILLLQSDPASQQCLL